MTETGLTIEPSAPDVHAQNGAAEKARGVLQVRGRKLKLQSNFPDHMEYYIFETAAYLLNRSPTRRLGWLSPLGKLQQLSGIRNPQPKLAYLHPYGCRAYTLRYDLNKLDRLESRVHISYLVGYESTNIFKI